MTKLDQEAIKKAEEILGKELYAYGTDDLYESKVKAIAEALIEWKKDGWAKGYDTAYEDVRRHGTGYTLQELVDK